MGNNEGVWLKITNVRCDLKKVEVQFEGDKSDKGAEWWPVNQSTTGAKDAIGLNSFITGGLDKQKIVLGKLKRIKNKGLKCVLIRIQNF